jgi:hypothetical protein
MRSLRGFSTRWARPNAPAAAIFSGRKAFDPIAEAIRGIVKQVDLLCKLAARVFENLSGESRQDGAQGIEGQ